MRSAPLLLKKTPEEKRKIFKNRDKRACECAQLGFRVSRRRAIKSIPPRATFINSGGDLYARKWRPLLTHSAKNLERDRVFSLSLLFFLSPPTPFLYPALEKLRRMRIYFKLSVPPRTKEEGETFEQCLIDCLARWFNDQKWFSLPNKRLLHRHQCRGVQPSTHAAMGTDLKTEKKNGKKANCFFFFFNMCTVYVQYFIESR